MSTLKVNAVTNLAAETPYQPTLMTAQASTSGTTIDFTGIPSWVKRITVMFNAVSTNGTSGILIQIGAGSVTATGYVGQSNSISAVVTAFSTGFLVENNVLAANTHSGNVLLCLLGSNTWAESGIVMPNTAANYGCVSGGVLALGGVLDRVRITTVSGTDTFDAGSINVMYE